LLVLGASILRVITWLWKELDALTIDDLAHMTDLEFDLANNNNPAFLRGLNKSLSSPTESKKTSKAGSRSKKVSTCGSASDSSRRKARNLQAMDELLPVTLDNSNQPSNQTNLSWESPQLLLEAGSKVADRVPWLQWLKNKQLQEPAEKYAKEKIDPVKYMLSAYLPDIAAGNTPDILVKVRAFFSLL
jgi:hypothetical protein